MTEKIVWTVCRYSNEPVANLVTRETPKTYKTRTEGGFNHTRRKDEVFESFGYAKEHAIALARRNIQDKKSELERARVKLQAIEQMKEPKDLSFGVVAK